MGQSSRGHLDHAHALDGVPGLDMYDQEDSGFERVVLTDDRGAREKFDVENGSWNTTP